MTIICTPPMHNTTNAQGVKRMRKTTCGWQLLVQWHDGAKQWIPLSVLKESNPAC
jgi:hypothetical protein